MKALTYLFSLDLLQLGDYAYGNKKGKIKIYIFPLVHYKYLHIFVQYKSDC